MLADFNAEISALLVKDARSELDRFASTRTGSGPPPPSNPVLTGGSGGGENEICEVLDLYLPAYHDQELNPDEANLVTRHLTSCPLCSMRLDAIRRNDVLVQREWRSSSPLPSSFEVRGSIQGVMNALPPASLQEFAHKRIHARTRWMRLSGGLAGWLVIMGLVGSSYYIGFTRGETVRAYNHVGALETSAKAPQKRSVR